MKSPAQTSAAPRVSFAPALVLAGLVNATAFMSSAEAETANASVGIVTNVIANCVSTTSPIAFGNYNPFDPQPLTAAGAVIITCTQDATPSVSISMGANASGGTRRMTAGSGSYLPYRILSPTSAAPNAGCSGATTDYPTVAPGFGLTPAPSFAPRSFSVCGQIATGVNAPVGTYSDTVLATVSF